MLVAIDMSKSTWLVAVHTSKDGRAGQHKVDGGDIITEGDLTVAGVTHPVEILWEFGGLSKDPFGNTRAGFDGTATLNRKDWGLVWNAAIETGGFLVSDKIKLVLEIAAVKQA